MVHLRLCLGFFPREEKCHVLHSDAPLCLAHTRLWTIVNVECVMDATFTDETVLTANASHTQETDASSAPVWYNTLCSYGLYYDKLVRS